MSGHRREKEDAAAEASARAETSPVPTPAETETSDPVATSSSPAADGDIPWYLKVDVPKHAALVPQDTPLPEIPARSPTLLQPLLTYVADDLGLDDLRLLDLRLLDPPAALGPDLLMLFGSARSERHLHVSADRLVRWLRKYGIHATADGLLGRNELKIKLRRKARRAKLLGNTGAPGGSNEIDDGISTQWVCLHAGTLGVPSVTKEEGSIVDAEGRMSGFGSLQVSTGTTVVVQMFTEAKRRQLNLETLWTRALQRSLKTRAEAGEDVSAWNAPETLSVSGEEETDMMNGSLEWASVPSSSPPKTQQAQRRSFSTSARRLAAVASVDVVSKLTQPLVGAADLLQIEQQLMQSTTDRVHILQRLARYLDDLPRAAALGVLGYDGLVGSLPASEKGEATPATDAPSELTALTPFTRAVNYCMHGLPASDTWAFRAAAHATGLRLGHPEYTLSGMGELIQEMQLCGVEASRDLCARILNAIFSARRQGENNIAVQEQQTEMALGLLDTLHERGQAILAGDLVISVITGLARTNQQGDLEALSNEITPADGQTPIELFPTRASSIPDEAAVTANDLQVTLEFLLRQARLPCPNEAQLTQLLDAYATQNDWDRFWGAWRLPPQHGQLRSASLYMFLFRRVAETGHQSRCIEALRRCFQEMLHEDVPVLPRGPVLEAMKACIRVADPQAERLARNLEGTAPHDTNTARLTNREFVRLLKAVETMHL